MKRRNKVSLHAVVATAVAEALNPPSDRWAEALLNRHLSPSDHKTLAAIDAEHERQKRICKRDPSKQNCGYDRDGWRVPRFANDSAKYSNDAWKAKQKAMREGKRRWSCDDASSP